MEDTIKKYVFDKGDVGMDWTCLFQDMDTSQALVNVVVNLLVP